MAITSLISNPFSAGTPEFENFSPNPAIQFGGMGTLPVHGGGVSGCLSRQHLGDPFPTGGQQPAATGADNVLAVFTLGGNSLDISRRGLNIDISGQFAATANAKRVKIFFNPTTAVVGQTISGGTLLADTGSSTASGAAFALFGVVYKYGANGSNTQFLQQIGGSIGSTHVGSGLAALTTAIEAGPILIAVTGNATTAATDILLNWFEVWGMC